LAKPGRTVLPVRHGGVVNEDVRVLAQAALIVQQVTAARLPPKTLNTRRTVSPSASVVQAADGAAVVQK
jgi:hypothetical protein